VPDLSRRAVLDYDLRNKMPLIRLLPPCRRHKSSRTWPSLRRSINHVDRSYKVDGGAMRGFHNSSFDPQTLVLLEAAFDEAWLTLKSIGNKTVRPDELARSVLRAAMEGEREPVRLHDEALKGLLPATAWREAS